MCVSYVRVWECSKPRCSTARSPNRAETQTTYRSNEGGNEKVIFTNFSQLYFHSVWLCVPSASLRATSATTCHAYTTKKAEKKEGRKESNKERRKTTSWWVSFDVAWRKQSLPILYAHTASCCRDSYSSRWLWSETMKPSAEMSFPPLLPTSLSPSSCR